MSPGSTSGEASVMMTVRVTELSTKPNSALEESVGGTEERGREREEGRESYVQRIIQIKRNFK